MERVIRNKTKSDDKKEFQCHPLCIKFGCLISISFLNYRGYQFFLSVLIVILLQQIPFFSAGLSPCPPSAAVKDMTQN